MPSSKTGARWKLANGKYKMKKENKNAGKWDMSTTPSGDVSTDKASANVHPSD